MAHWLLRDVEADGWERPDFPIIRDNPYVRTFQAMNGPNSSKYEDWPEWPACKKANTEEKLTSQIEELNSTISFLRSSPQHCFSDVVLVASDDPSAQPIPASRAILSSRSPVFRAMLEAEMEESISKTINIREVSHDALGLFVGFLYTAEANDLDEKMACDLLVLADKYQVLHLKSYCEKLLMSMLNWEKSLPFYAFACQHNADSLSLISANLKKLQQREDYAEFVEKDPRMLLQIYEAHARHS